MGSLVQEINRKRFVEYLQGITQNLSQSFLNTMKYPWFFLHLLAISITIPVVIVGIDWAYFLIFRDHIYLQILLFPAVPIGSFIPLFVPPIIYLYAKKEEKPELEPIALAMTQAAVVGLFWSALYKSFTGRMGPEFDEFEHGMKDYSTDFAFGLLRRGVFDGWPSSHTTIAWAIAFVFYFYRPELESNRDSELHKYRKYAFPYAMYIAIGVSTNIHWLSDTIAGFLIGITVGRSVTHTFDSKWEKEKIEGIELKYVYFMLTIVFLTIIFSIFGFDDLNF